jgi:hypothetical protein
MYSGKWNIVAFSQHPRANWRYGIALLTRGGILTPVEAT